MLRNPDLAIPLYIMVVVSGILLSKKWRPFIDSITSAGNTVGSHT